MKALAPPVLPQYDCQSLHSLLEHAQQRALERNTPQLVSLSFATEPVDPLAALHTIGQPNTWHGYFERPDAAEAVAGSEAIVHQTFSGPKRFQALRDYATTLWQHTVIADNPTLPFPGPHFFCSFTFFDDPEEATPAFAPATIFVPRWQVARRGTVYTRTINTLIDPQTDLASAVDHAWQTYQTLQNVPLMAPTPGPLFAPQDRSQWTETCGEGWYPQAVAQGLAGIARDEYDKIVLARVVERQAQQPLRPLAALYNLRQRFPNCFTFSFANDQQQSFIGATPERLLRIDNNTLQTEALAGSAPRGPTAREDTQLAAKLNNSTKDRREQQLVLQAIIQHLETLGISPQVDSHPHLLRLHNVQHLQTTITGTVPPNRHLLDILQKLHPTPAVGGTPRRAALAAIRSIEPFARGLYAGTLGWFDGYDNGEMLVAIRSALIDSGRAHACLYAGAGIVQGSEPQKELQETEMKLQALINAL